MFLRLIADTSRAARAANSSRLRRFPLGMAVATATLSVSLDAVIDSRKNSDLLGANLVRHSRSRFAALEIGGVDFRPPTPAPTSPNPISQKSNPSSGTNNITAFAPEQSSQRTRRNGTTARKNLNIDQGLLLSGLG